MNEKINLVKSNGTVVEGDIICLIEDTSNSKRYVYYTLNEIVNAEPSQNIKVYVAKIKQNDMTDVPISEEEWGKLKGFMGEVLKDVDNPNIKYLPESELVEPTIVDEKVIAMPTMYDYISKHRGVYATKVASLESVSAPQASENVNVTPVIEQLETAPQVETPATEIVTPIETPVVEEAASVTAEVPLTETAPSIEPQIVVPVISPMVEEANLNDEHRVEEQPAIMNEVAPLVNNQSLEKIDIDLIENKYNEMIASLTELKNKEIEAANRFNATLELNAMHNEQHANYIQGEQEPDIASSPVPEPVPIEPAPIEPAPATTNSDVNIETNWFDMPPQG